MAATIWSTRVKGPSSSSSTDGLTLLRGVAGSLGAWVAAGVLSCSSSTYVSLSNDVHAPRGSGSCLIPCLRARTEECS